MVGTWILLGAILGGVGILMYILYNDKSGAAPCCGCGQCVATGHCVMRSRKAAKKEEKSRLDKS